MRTIVGLILALGATSAAAAYKCKDEHGLTHFGDIPPAACANVVVYEVDNLGMVVRKIEPTPSPEQLHRLQEEQSKRKESERAAAEQKRHDEALLASYSSEKEIDITRDRNIEPVQARIASAQERIREIDKHRKELQDQLEFYRAGHAKGRDAKAHEPPPMLVADLDRTTREKQSLEASIVSAKKEIEAIRARYDGDKKRWIEVRRGGSGVTPASAPAGDAKAVRKN